MFHENRYYTLWSRRPRYPLDSHHHRRGSHEGEPLYQAGRGSRNESASSDLIPLGGADVIISMEPMEALRYLPFLAKDGWIITSSAPFVNIPNYPDIETIKKDLEGVKNVIILDIEQAAKDNGVPRSANVILLGAAQKALGIEYDKLEDAIRRVFGRKGEAIVEANIKALAIGKAAQK